MGFTDSSTIPKITWEFGIYKRWRTDLRLGVVFHGHLKGLGSMMRITLRLSLITKYNLI
jgi:hypothetical protein